MSIAGTHSMSRETLKSNALSCASLGAGVDASAALAGLKLQKMSGDQIKKLLQDRWGSTKLRVNPNTQHLMYIYML